MGPGDFVPWRTLPELEEKSRGLTTAFSCLPPSSESPHAPPITGKREAWWAQTPLNSSAQVGSGQRSFHLHLILPSLKKKIIPKAVFSLCIFLSPCKRHLVKCSESSCFPRISGSPHLERALRSSALVGLL